MNFNTLYQAIKDMDTSFGAKQLVNLIIPWSKLLSNKNIELKIGI